MDKRNGKVVLATARPNCADYPCQLQGIYQREPRERRFTLALSGQKHVLNLSVDEWEIVGAQARQAKGESKSMRTVYKHQGDRGPQWYAVEDGASCRLTGSADTSDREGHDYEPECSLCWLGYGHSADYHRAALAAAGARA